MVDNTHPTEGDERTAWLVRRIADPVGLPTGVQISLVAPSSKKITDIVSELSIHDLNLCYGGWSI